MSHFTKLRGIAAGKKVKNIACGSYVIWQYLSIHLKRIIQGSVMKEIFHLVLKRDLQYKFFNAFLSNVDCNDFNINRTRKKGPISARSDPAVTVLTLYSTVHTESEV